MASSGGGLRIGSEYEATALLERSLVCGNSASGSGGGLVGDYPGSLRLNESTVTNNSADGNGGGIYAESLVRLDDSDVLDNAAGADGDGGGVFARGYGIIFATGGRIAGNAARNGGGVHLAGQQLTVIGSQVTGNTALSGDGGGIDINSNYGPSVSVRDSTLSGNSAADEGGAINARSGAPITLLNSALEHNIAEAGGGISTSDAAYVDLSTFPPTPRWGPGARF